MANEKIVFGSFKAQAAHGAQTGVKKADIFKVPVEKILEEPGFNARDYNDEDVIAQIEGFAQSYSDGEIVPPLYVRIDPQTGEFFLVDGHQRLRGAKLAISRGAEIDVLDCLPFRGGDADRVVHMLRSAEGLKLKPLGVAMSYLKLQRMGKTNQEIAQRVGRTASHVESMLVLATANSDVHSLVKEGAVAATVAIEAVRKYGEKAGAELGAKLVKAKAEGKTQVKASAVKEWVPPRKATLDIYHAMSGAFKDNHQLHDLLKQGQADPSELEGKTVTLDAGVVAKLFQAFKAAEELKHKRESKAATAQTSEDSDGVGSAQPQ